MYRQTVTNSAIAENPQGIIIVKYSCPFVQHNIKYNNQRSENLPDKNTASVQQCRFSIFS